MIKHGLYKHPIYKCRKDMKYRCFNKKSKRYKYYGLRGITVYKERINNFPLFLSYIGEKPGTTYSIDRIDVNGNYEPGNIRWANKSEQQRNKRCNKKFQGKDITERSNELGITYSCLQSRVYRKGREDAILPRPLA